MEDKIKVIAAGFDDLEVERVFIVDNDGRSELRAVVSGVLCHVDSKPRLLAAGLVTCFPLDAETAAN